MTVSILGCGWYGLELARSFVQKGIIVKGSTTSVDKLTVLAAAKITPYLIDLSPDGETYDPEFFECDILWVCIPPKTRSGNGAAYLEKIKSIINAIESHAIKQMIFISSTAVYGDLNVEVNGLSRPEPDTESGNILLQAEGLLRDRPDFTTTIIRFAGLIGPGRDPGRFFAGKTNIPNGNAPVNLIHLIDCIGISHAILDKEAFGHIYNACSPNHPTRSEFYTKAAARAGLEVPAFIDEKKTWKIVSTINTGDILNYKFKIDNLTIWLDQARD
jgi:nucleoside-diphosphate-sugar epimerase